VVVAHNGSGFVERVKCLTCGSEHKYRSDKKRAAPKTPRKSVTVLEVKLTESFEKLSEKFKEKKPLSYSMSGSFKNDDVIDHSTFGRGFVTSAAHDKMEVVFSDGPRTLACNRQAAV
jgi:hypothetical protein